MPESELEKEARRFARKCRDAIESAGAGMIREERVRLVRSIVTNYNPLSPQEAENFIERYPDLIEYGWDQDTPPERRR